MELSQDNISSILSEGFHNLKTFNNCVKASFCKSSSFISEIFARRSYGRTYLCNKIVHNDFPGNLTPKLSRLFQTSSCGFRVVKANFYLPISDKQILKTVNFCRTNKMRTISYLRTVNINQKDWWFSALRCKRRMYAYHMYDAF